MASGDLYYYSFNPCKPFNEIACSNAAVCQVDAAKTMSYQAGDYDQATWSFDGINLLVTYDSYADPLTFRKSIVTYVCDESATEPTMNAIGETIATTYEMTVVTKCACKNACSGGSIDVTVEVSLSTGSIMVIIFFVLLIVYVVAGILFNRFRRQSTGMDMVPNISFWRAIPGYIKDGFVFTTSKIRPKKSGYDEV